MQQTHFKSKRAGVWCCKIYMSITLVVNPGSSSKKYALYSNRTLQLNAYIERTKEGFEMCTAVGGFEQGNCELVPHQGYHDSLDNFLQRAKSEGFIHANSDIKKVAIRVVAPGTYFQTHRVIDEVFMKKLRACVSLAPLHVPHIEHELQALLMVLPQAQLVSVSDSAFHSTMPESARLYSLPKKDYEEFDLYRFGYHGLSVASAVRRLHAVTGTDPKRAIVCHLGSGVSVTALRAGQSVETTMGYAPGSGLIMGSRAGDLDPGALLTIMQCRNLKPVDTQTYIQTYGGLKGIAGEADLRFLLERRAKGDKSATLAIASFVHQIRKAIGAQLLVLGGVDTIVFTATAGERSPVLRALIMENLEDIGILIDEDKNEACVSRDGVISDFNSKIKTDEAAEILYASEEVE